MESTAAHPRTPAARPPAKFSPPAAATFGLAFALVVYLGFDGGGYDTVSRSELGVGIWWIVLLGALLGVLPLRALGRGGWLALGLLAAFGAWTALSLTWTESIELTHLELARVAVLLGVLALALGLRRDGSTVMPMLSGVGAAIAAIAAAAVLSRLRPAWFPVNETARFLGQGSQSRLNYPVNYWNALAELIALGIPLVLAAASDARRMVVRAGAAGTLPLMGVAVYLTYSRAGVGVVAAALIVYLALARERLPKLAVALVVGVATAGLIAAIEGRPAVADGLTTAGARSQGDQLLVLVLAACLVTAVGAAAITHTARRSLRGWTMPRLHAQRIAAAAAALVVLIGVVLGATGTISRAWDDFKHARLDVPPAQVNLSPRFANASGNGRYQLWQAAIRENATRPMRGTGAGTFQLWWQRRGSPQTLLRHAHSYFFETFGELGWIGLILGVGFFMSILTVATRRTLGSPPVLRTWLAAGTAACASFTVAASVDWVWQLTVLPAAFLIVAAAIVGGRREPEAEPRRSAGRRALALRVAIAAIAGLGLVAVIPPLASTVALRASQREAAAGHLAAALRDAGRAVAVEPDDASPRLQRAIVLELAHQLPAAAAAAGQAVAREPTNWQNWLILSRVEAEAGRSAAGLRDFTRARALNPRPPVFGP